MDPFEIHRRHPTHQQRLAAEKQVNVYFIPGSDKKGGAHYAYVVCSALLHEKFVQAVMDGIIPDFAVVVETGSGLPPPEKIQRKMHEYYGFEEKEAESI
jgi:hypothetical protein